ncbi:DNA repair protein rad16 [Coemansia sp. RSA 1813]|nr:DNA repair protein rad16 [Coemansia sp. RSA 1843]KAJ2085932.1 DNA repair protein rad16 [Coemansia sp. RSA 986]KAJ2210211.1 DNA repair protein rad16 [Coemansia sp. RSA 487]KAJ2563496.1 DNA repair protein rad16 [Coemansia sp. RSA 1813]
MVTTRGSSRSHRNAVESPSDNGSASSTAVATPISSTFSLKSAATLTETLTGRRKRNLKVAIANSISDGSSTADSGAEDQVSVDGGVSDYGTESSSSNDFVSSSSESDSDTPATSLPARRRAFAGNRARRGRAFVERGPQSPPRKKLKIQTPVAEMMPVFGDMKLLIAPLSPVLDDDDAAGAFLGENRGSKYHYSMVSKRRRNKNGKQSRKFKDLLEGDLTDLEPFEGLVDPRKLPKDDIDYSPYCRLFLNHPHLRHAWSSLEPATADKKMGKIGQPRDLKMKLLPFQQEGVWWMAQQETSVFRGGILADEMGMGKTLQTIALLLVNRGKPTLVVCPTVALMQWKAEIEMATDSLSVLIFYGNERKKLLDADSGDVDMEQLEKYDVILTTYAVMESGFRRERTGFRSKGALRKEPSVLHRIEWFRLVLDEAHNLKDRSSNSARAAFELHAQRVWSLTGTPLHNRVGELYSLIRLTKSDPFSMYFCHECTCKSLHWNFARNGGTSCTECGHMYTRHFCFWNMHVLKPIQKHPASTLMSRVGFRKLGRLLDNVMLRRTKIERAQDLGLPPRVVVTRRDKFSPAEEDFYVSLFTDYQREFDTYAQHGTVLNNYANIFELITRMRLAANHPDLLRLKVNSARVGCDSDDTLVCAICNEEAEDPIVSRCKHVFCRVDAQMYITGAGDEAAAILRCPMCYAVFDIDLTQPEMQVRQTITNHSGGDGATLMETMMSTPHTTEYRRSIVNRIDMRQWRSSTKIEALVEELSRHRRSNTNIKSIVFSQFVNFLDLIQWRLNRAGFSVCRLDGRMSPTQRDAVIRTFMTHPEYTVFLVSLKAGGVALNLTEASHVYLADCWWNPSVEVQAMDRIHRMGQHRPIKVTRIIIENSIESRIVALQVKKQMLVNSTIGRDRKSLDQLSQQDMQFLFSS